MPSLTNVYLEWAFFYNRYATIRGGTYVIPLSRIDIGALRSYF